MKKRIREQFSEDMEHQTIACFSRKLSNFKCILCFFVIMHPWHAEPEVPELLAIKLFPRSPGKKNSIVQALLM